MIGNGQGDVNRAQKHRVEWRGIFPAALTMFSSNGHLDEDETANHISGLISQGAMGIVVGGTSGEFIALDRAERERVISIGVEAAESRVPVIAGTGLFSTAATVELTQSAERLGADGALVILPYYQRPTLGEVVDHIRAVAESTDLPVCVYNNPRNSGAPLIPTPVLSSLYYEGFASAVKSTVPTVHEIHELRDQTDDGFRIFYGTFMAPLEAMAGGAHGWISGILNVVLPEALDLWTAMAAGDLESARRAWARILPIRDVYVSGILGEASDLAIYRGILRLKGEHGGWCRPPLRSLSRQQMADLEATLDRIETRSTT